MNDWNYKEKCSVEADDFQDRWDRNGLNFLFWWKTKTPDFKITLFTIPDRTSDILLKLIEPHKDWIRLAVHGWNHESNFECWQWDELKTNAYLDRIEKTGAYIKMFKAPGWQITDKYSGYYADVETPVGRDPQIVYKVLTQRGYTIIDRHYNKPARPKDSHIICIDDNPQIVHFHTWDMETGDKAGRNGFRQVEEEHGLPWDNKTIFRWLEEEINPCQD